MQYGESTYSQGLMAVNGDSEMLDQLSGRVHKDVTNEYLDVALSTDVEDPELLKHRFVLLSVLLELKKFLKQSYGLSDAKCAEFDPRSSASSSSRVMGHPSQQLDLSHIDKEASFVNLFVQFRKLFRSDSSSDVGETEGMISRGGRRKRKSGTKRKRKSAKKEKDELEALMDDGVAFDEDEEDEEEAEEAASFQKVWKGGKDDDFVPVGGQEQLGNRASVGRRSGRARKVVRYDDGDEDEDWQ